MAMGLVSVGLGLVPLLAAVGVLPAASPTGTPVWLGGLLVFVVAGGSILARALMPITGREAGKPSAWARVGQAVAVLFILAALGAIGSWIAFGPGERGFSMSIGGQHADGAEWLGRLMFGLGSLITWASFAAILIGRRRATAAAEFEAADLTV